MVDNKLRLLLLLTVAVSKAQDEEVPCLMAKRYKPFNKYEYFYETESLNTLNGAVNGPKASCKVEIAAPGTCSYIVRTTDCTLSEVIDVDADGKPVFGAVAGAEDFKTAMERRPLKFTVEGDDDIKLFPEEDELINILNIKRGIISALAVPVLEEDRNKDMPTIYGLCKTDYVVNTREDVATEVTLRRDLSDCDKFRPVDDHTSPLALITGMKYPLAQLIRSSQICNYKFNNEQHHMTSGTCTEKHVLALFSHKGEHGVVNTGKQALTLLGVAKYSDRVFDHNVANMKPLHPDSSVDMSPVQDKEAALVVLREIAGLSKTNDGHKRAHLAHKLVAVIRKMEAETLTAVVPEALEISQSLTYQALLQCGTPECSSAVMQIFRTFDKFSGEIDAAVYAMGMIPRSSRVLVKEMLAMAKFKPSKPIYYALSNAVRRLFETDGVTSEIQAVADYALEQIGDCTGDQGHVFLSLKVIGNMVAALGAACPALQSSVIQCMNQPTASPAVQHAAVQVYRQIPVPEEGREVLMHAVLDRAASVQKRVAAYLILMKNPRPAELAQLTAALLVEENPQVKSFIISHISNILSSTAPETLDLRQKIQEAFQGNEIEMLMEPDELSRYYRLGSFEGNMIFESPNELPREVMLEMTLNAFGFDMDLIEIGMEGQGFEPIVGALFGDDGFFPDIIMKTTLYATDKMPTELNEVLDNMLPFMGNDRKKRQASQNIVNEISQNINKLIEDLKAQDAPEAMVYLKLLGAELGYLDTKDGKMIHNLLKMIPTDFLKRLLSSVDNELFLHYIFMDNEFYLPTGAGFPLRVALSGTFTPGVKGGLSFNPGRRELALTLSAGIEFVTEIGTHFPDYVNCGLEMHTNIYHESGVKAKLSVTNSQLKLSIPALHGPTELIKVTAPVETALPSQRIQTPEELVSQQEEHVQIMYCKDQVYQGDEEFSLEELRAQRYYRALSEKASHINRVKQELQLQIEQKQRLLQQRLSTAPQVVDEEADSSSGVCEAAATVLRRAPVVIYSELEEGPAVQRKSSVSREEDTNQSVIDVQQQKTATAKPFSASDENRQTNKPSSSANRVSLKLPTSSLKGPKSKPEPSADKQDSSLSRCEEAIVNGHWNKTLCRSPDDTCEFARATHLASTPFGGVERQKLPENPESTKAPSSNLSPEEKKLSPILEISQELGGTSFANFSQDPMKRFNDTEISRAVEEPETVLENVSVSDSEDVCSPGVRARLFQQADVTTFYNFHRKTELLPDTSGDLNLDGETLVYRGVRKDFTLYSSSNATVLLKLDGSSVPWDFFISSRLRARGSHDQQDRLVQISCYVFENGCMTLWRIPHGETIEDLLAEPIARPDVSRLVLLLLELVKQFHSCQVVHGGLKPETLYSYHSGITALDFSNAVDLQLQTDVKTAQDLPSAQKYIQQGLLSASASPYQVDLIGLAEVVHMLLFNRPMKVTQENSAWSLDEGSGSDLSAPVSSSWKDFFLMTLNPEQKSSSLVLCDLIMNVSDSL